MTPRIPPDAPRLETREAWAVIRRDKIGKRSFIDIDTVGLTAPDAERKSSGKDFRLKDWAISCPRIRTVPVLITELMVPEQVRE